MAVIAGPTRAERITVYPGETVRQAIVMSRQLQLQQRTRAAWLGAGRPVPNDTPAPAITSGKVTVTKMSVQAGPLSPSVQFSYTTGPAGLAYVILTFESQTTSQAMQIYYAPNAFAPITSSGGLAVHTPVSNDLFAPSLFGPASLGFYAAPGTWTLGSATIADHTGTATYYDQAQLAQIFRNPTITVTNTGQVDATVPSAVTGQVMTPSVSLSGPSPYFEAVINATDDLSGVGVTAVYVTAPGGTNNFGNTNDVANPTKSVAVPTYTDLRGQPTGTYGIYGYLVCDVAGNCLQDFNPADVQRLFGTTTFQVTP